MIFFVDTVFDRLKIMYALILKDLRSYTHSRKYRIIQFIILAVLTLLLFGATVEFYAQGINKQQVGKAIGVGKQTYTFFIVCLFMSLFSVPTHAVEAVYMERSATSIKDHQNRRGENGAMLALTPLPNWKILGGKLAAVVIWALWGIGLTIPLFALSSYIGGLAAAQLIKSGMVILVSCIFFTMIGIGFALWHSGPRAKGISYGFILAITFFPLFPITPFNAIPMFDILSPLCALLSILQSDAPYLWIWNVCLFCGLCFAIFPVLCRRVP
ncbi:MAG: hypothetical protein OXI43_06525 [Candidatus Poribacteria bacterium]|nr:hypothetical protein [Candidatus Poribacteria bacterium]